MIMDEHRETMWAVIFTIINNQIRDETPPETKQTLDRLIAEGHAEKEAMKLIGEVVATEVFEVLKEGREYDNAKYVAALEALG